MISLYYKVFYRFNERNDNSIMSNKRKKSRVRYDRIIGVAAVFIVLIILLVSCTKSCGKGKKNDGESSIVPTSSVQDKNNENASDATDSGGDSEAAQNTTGTSDMEFSSISALPNEVFSGDLILVNKDHAYSFPAFEAGTEGESDITPIYELASESYKFKDYEVSLSAKTITALNSMMDDFYSQTGKNDIMVIDGYRSKESQDEVGDPEVPGGYSEYHTGLSFDLGIFPEEEDSYYYTPDGDYAWINDNCANYGFILRYPTGKETKTGFEAKDYQFRYVGIPHALYMKENKLCLEEYIDVLKGYTSTGEHLSISDGTKMYEIYYAPADPSANTDIPVPDGKDYTVSGNNVDGFIITVEV